MIAKQYHWRHFFGGAALVFLTVQLVSGMVLTLFYSPHLNEAYASVQRLYNEIPAVAWIRDSHRWAAFFLVVAAIVHAIRSVLRKDYLIRNRRFSWLTGTLALLPLLGFLVTGMILPWEWRGYWFMEMVPNYFGGLPLFGPALGDFLIDAFTLNRAFVAHVVVFPAITLVLLDIHAIARMKKRNGGLSLYLYEHAVFVLPLLAVIAVLAWALPMPSQDPQIVPMPLEGEKIPMAEWFVLVFYTPWLYVKGFAATFIGFFAPLAVFTVLALLPFLLRTGAAADRPERAREPQRTIGERLAAMHALAPLRAFLGLSGLTRALGALGVTGVAAALFVPLYTVSYASPTMGCNSCHNASAGRRMGVPPETFKDRVLNPNLKDNTFMVEHWFYPQVVW